MSRRMAFFIYHQLGWLTSFYNPPTAYGLGTIPTYNSVRFPAILHQTLDVPDDERFIVGISLGYSADTTINSYHSERRPVNEILHFN